MQICQYSVEEDEDEIWRNLSAEALVFLSVLRTQQSFYFYNGKLNHILSKLQICFNTP